MRVKNSRILSKLNILWFNCLPSTALSLLILYFLLGFFFSLYPNCVLSIWLCLHFSFLCQFFSHFNYKYKSHLQLIYYLKYLPCNFGLSDTPCIICWLFLYTLYPLLAVLIHLVSSAGCSDTPCILCLMPWYTLYPLLAVLMHPVSLYIPPLACSVPILCCIYSWGRRYLGRVWDSLFWRGNSCLAAQQRNSYSSWM